MDYDWYSQCINTSLFGFIHWKKNGIVWKKNIIDDLIKLKYYKNSFKYNNEMHTTVKEK